MDELRRAAISAQMSNLAVTSGALRALAAVPVGSPRAAQRHDAMRRLAQLGEELERSAAALQACRSASQETLDELIDELQRVRTGQLKAMREAAELGRHRLQTAEDAARARWTHAKKDREQREVARDELVRSIVAAHHVVLPLA